MNRFRPLIYRQAMQLLRDPDDSEDATQEVLLKLYRFLPQFRHRAKLSTWIYRITYNVCMSLAEKRRKAWQGLSWTNGELDTDLDTVLAQREAATILYEAVWDLPAKYRVPVSLYYLLDMPYREIAVRTGLRMNTVKVRVHRGVRLLQRRFVTTGGLMGEHARSEV
ncbi:MAG: RNA polymerase sigma factor [bacterium]